MSSTGRGGGLAASGIARKTLRAVSRPTTPYVPAAVPKGIRALVAPHAMRLTARMLESGAGVASRDSYVLNLRRDLGQKQKAQPVLMILAIAYDVVVARRKPASDATAWMKEAIALIEQWERAVRADRIDVPDIRLALVRENRREGMENEAALLVTANQDDPHVLRQFIDAGEAEIETQREAIAIARQRLAVVESRADA